MTLVSAPACAWAVRWRIRARNFTVPLASPQLCVNVVLILLYKRVGFPRFQFHDLYAVMWIVRQKTVSPSLLLNKKFRVLYLGGSYLWGICGPVPTVEGIDQIELLGYYCYLLQIASKTMTAGKLA